MPFDVAAEVIENRALSSDYHVLALSAPSIAAASIPGQFVMIKASRGHDPLLRRPFSVFEVLRDPAGVPTGISILSKRVGVSTRLLYAAQPGDHIDCLGPLGRPFSVIDPPAEAWMVAGGVGLAPFAELAHVLRARGVTTVLFYGARSGGELFSLDLFRRLGVELVLTTEDGSAGERGRIIAPLDRRLAEQRDRGPITVYACGPEGMLEAVATSAARAQRSCEVSVERIMGCGLGGCYSCVVPMRGDDGHVHHVRSCIAGPVLDGARIQWP